MGIVDMLDSATRIWPYWLGVWQRPCHLLVISIEVLLCSKKQLTCGNPLLSTRVKHPFLAAPGQRWGVHIEHERVGRDLAIKICDIYIASARLHINASMATHWWIHFGRFLAHSANSSRCSKLLKILIVDERQNVSCSGGGSGGPRKDTSNSRRDHEWRNLGW